MSESITIVRKVKPVKLLSRINDGVTANVASGSHRVSAS